MNRPRKQSIEYRVVDLQPDRPYLCLSGEPWRPGDAPGDHLHFHNCLEIAFCLSDSGALHFEDGVAVPFASGDIFLIPRFVPHAARSAGGCASRWAYLLIDPDALCAMLRCGAGGLDGMAGGCLRLTPSDERPYALCRWILEEAQRPAGQDGALLALYAMALMQELRRRIGDDPAAQAGKGRSFALRPALQYISGHYAEPCGTQKLSALCYLSQTHFRRLFLSIMGIPPLQYVITVRIRQACILLTTTSEPIAAIAQAVGMRSISSFNRNFQQLMGVSPQQYRRAAASRRAPRGA